MQVKKSGTDKKWEELSNLLQNNKEMFDTMGQRRKLIIFTEHRDTLNILHLRISNLLGRPEAVVTIHGGMRREDRKKSESLFTQDKNTEVLLATDAAGEGINLQRAHLLINYDLPWNPNRLEQRFGRIHRIGQTEGCHCWNLVASKTREGNVFQRLLVKLEQERASLGGKVFDILGQLLFDGRPLRDLLVQAVRYGDSPEARLKFDEIVDNTMNREHLEHLIDEHALSHDVMDVSKVMKVRESMERAETRKLQPHFIASFFMEAFKRLGGTLRERESRRYEVTMVPADVRNGKKRLGRQIPLLKSYERVTFDKNLTRIPGKPLAEFLCPGQPLLDAVIDLTLDRNGAILKQGTILIDNDDTGRDIRVLVYIEHCLQDAGTDDTQNRRIVSRQFRFVEIDSAGNAQNAGYSPYLDYQPPTEEENAVIRQRTLPTWTQVVESSAKEFAVEQLVPQHLNEFRSHKNTLIEKTRAAVQKRLTSEITYWDKRAETLKEQERAGKTNARINSDQARKRADELHDRMKKRLQELEQEKQITPLPPNIVGAAMIIPIGLLEQAMKNVASPPAQTHEKKKVECLAMNAVMAKERELGFCPKDVSADKCGYDIESHDPTGKTRLRFIEVKGRVRGAAVVTVTKNEILTALNKPEQFILALVEVDGETANVTYISKPFTQEPEFGVTSVNYKIEELLAKGGYS